MSWRRLCGWCPPGGLRARRAPLPRRERCERLGGMEPRARDRPRSTDCRDRFARRDAVRRLLRGGVGARSLWAVRSQWPGRRRRHSRRARSRRGAGGASSPTGGITGYRARRYFSSSITSSSMDSWSVACVEAEDRTMFEEVEETARVIDFRAAGGDLGATPGPAGQPS